MNKGHITVDDFGMSLDINQAAEILFDHRAINRISFVANTDIFDQSVSAIKRMKGVSLFAHLNITDGRPVSSQKEVQTLIGPNGYFIGGRHKRVIKNILIGKFSIDEIKREWAAQIQRILDAGIKIDGINTHGHLHFLPQLYPAVTHLISQFYISKVRLILNDKTVKGLILRQASKSLKKRLKRDRIHLTYEENVVCMNWQGKITKFNLLKALNRAKKKSFEVVTHPSTSKGAYHLSWGYDPVHEMNTLLDHDVLQMIKRAINNE